MNESDFENELRALKPAVPSRAWSERVARAMAAEPLAVSVHPRSGLIAPSEEKGSVAAALRRFCWSLAGAAATALVIVTLRPARDVDGPARGIAASSRPGDVTRSVETARALVEAEEEPVFDNDSQEPARRIRFVFLERHTWTDPQTGTLIAVEVPREDVFLVPVAMQ